MVGTLGRRTRLAKKFIEIGTRGGVKMVANFRITCVWCKYFSNFCTSVVILCWLCLMWWWGWNCTAPNTDVSLVLSPAVIHFVLRILLSIRNKRLQPVVARQERSNYNRNKPVLSVTEPTRLSVYTAV